MTEEQFVSLWERYWSRLTHIANSQIMDFLPDDVEKFCEEHEITVDYFIEEFM